MTVMIFNDWLYLSSHDRDDFLWLIVPTYIIERNVISYVKIVNHGGKLILVRHEKEIELFTTEDKI